MRVCKKRYHTELLRMNLAARMVEHEARTETIRRWSGVSEQRVRELYRASKQGRSVRHRGPAPRKPALFLKASNMRSEASALAAVCYAMDLITPRAARAARRDLETVQQGERLCRAYEMYQRLVEHSELTLEHAALLVTTLTEGTELRLGRCIYCGNGTLFDPCGNNRRTCGDCARSGRSEPTAPSATIPQSQGERPVQQKLF